MELGPLDEKYATLAERGCPMNVLAGLNFTTGDLFNPIRKQRTHKDYLYSLVITIKKLKIKMKMVIYTCRTRVQEYLGSNDEIDCNAREVIVTW